MGSMLPSWGHVHGAHKSHIWLACVQATDSGVSQGALVGTVENYKFRSSLKGTACGPDMASVCPTSSLTFAPMTSSIRVYVQQVVPVFESAVGAQGFQGTPPAGALPHAYPNCPMPAVPIYVWKANAELELSLSFGRSSGDDPCFMKHLCGLFGTQPTPKARHRKRYMLAIAAGVEGLVP